ncbi:MAG: hypothetical protein RL632_211 [Bacteroidota bacterium]|jgi:signal transduction histidine kinase
MFRVHCVIVFIFCSVLLRATDTLVPMQDLSSVVVSKVLESNVGGRDDRHRADIYRALVAKKIKTIQKENDDARQKIQEIYEVEHKELHLGRLRISNNEHRAIALKLQNNLLLTSLWVVLTSIGLLAFLLYRRRVEHEKRSLQFRRASFAAREQEKLRFSRELHDDFQSTLSIIHMMAVHEYDQSPENLRLTELKNSSKNAIQEIRKLSDDLYPREINTEGCIESLNALLRRTNKENKRLTFFMKADDFECDKDFQIVLYRSVELLVKNTLSFSDAIEVEVSLRKMKHGVELHYMENGISMSRQKRDATKVRESIQNIGGKFSEEQVSADKCSFRLFFSD